MARKPVHLLAALPRPQGRDVVWAAIRKLRRFSLLDLEHETRINTSTIHTYVLGLTHAGYLVTDGKGRAIDGRGSIKFRQARWELVKDVGVEAPRVTRKGADVTQGRGNDAMWRALRALGEFDARDLAGVARVPEVAAVDYTKHLARAGYLQVLHKGAPGTLTRYRFVPSRNSGPRAPMVQRIKQVFDPNLGRVVWPVAEAHA